MHANLATTTSHHALTDYIQQASSVEDVPMHCYCLYKVCSKIMFIYVYKRICDQANVRLSEQRIRKTVCCFDGITSKKLHNEPQPTEAMVNFCNFKKIRNHFPLLHKILKKQQIASKFCVGLKPTKILAFNYKSNLSVVQWERVEPQNHLPYAIAVKRIKRLEYRFRNKKKKNNV